jgi:hypothetical protein
MLSLLFVESALGGDMPAPKPPLTTDDPWQTYRSERGGFSVEFPTTWTIEERFDAHGALVTLLRPPGGTTISIVSQTDMSLDQDDTDLPNTHCKNVQVAGLPGRTCLDTISFNVSTTLVASGKTYLITSGRKQSDRRLYDRILASFRIRR